MKGFYGFIIILCIISTGICIGFMIGRELELKQCKKELIALLEEEYDMIEDDYVINLTWSTNNGHRIDVWHVKTDSNSKKCKKCFKSETGNWKVEDVELLW